MKELVIAALLAAAAFASTADAGPYGVVESVREVPLRKYPAGLAELFEHVINPETAERVLVEANPFNSPTERSSP